MHKYITVASQTKQNFLQKIIIQPNKPYFHKDWEWFYDFPQIRNKIISLFIYYFKLLILYFVNKLNLSDYPYYLESYLKEINISDLEEYLLKATSNNNKILMTNKCMIIFGPDMRNDMYKFLQSFQTSVDIKYAIGNNRKQYYVINNIPACFIPTISGIHVIPDLTGQWSENIYDGFEETSARKIEEELRRHYRY